MRDPPTWRVTHKEKQKIPSDHASHRSFCTGSLQKIPVCFVLPTGSAIGLPLCVFSHTR
jgi:hypothetical protein